MKLDECGGGGGGWGGWEGEETERSASPNPTNAPLSG